MAGREKDCRWVWSVGAKMLRGSRGLSARVVCRDKYGEWVKRPVGGCGLSGQVWRVGQRNCRRVWSVGTSMASGSRELSAGVVCRGEKGEWVKGIGDGVWSVGAKTASESKKPHISYAPNVANRHSDQNCQNPQNMIHLL